MAFVLRDRVKETTSSTGTGSVTLAGAASGFQSFSVIGNGNTTYYAIVGTTEWEVGIGTYTSSGTTLSRDTVLESSNGGSLVNFSAGTKDVFVTYPGERAVYASGTGHIGIPDPGTSGNGLVSNGTDWVSQASVVQYPQNTQSGNYTLVIGDAGKHIYCTNTGSQTITIPTNASVAFPVGATIRLINIGTGNAVIGASGITLYKTGSATALSGSYMVPSGGSATFTKVATNSWWVDGSFELNVYTASYLVVAGGGGGGSSSVGAAGGGAGGLRTGTQSISPGTTYTVTVGAGGGGGPATGSGAAGSDGSNSVFSSITSTGGGGGAGSGSTISGRNGGSGGGGMFISSAGGTGVAGQGNNGGTGSSSNYAGGGGGGAGAVGGNASGVTPGNGGNGSASSITGSSVTYAGGGGGAGNTAGAGGTGGGGAGVAFGGNGTSGTANLGGGGGGGGWSPLGTGGSGGSGVVIISVPTASYSGTHTGSPTVTTSGSNTILKFTSSGSYTA